jgi:LmbE family N-acetylglucosaminyl deacetylase
MQANGVPRVAGADTRTSWQAVLGGVRSTVVTAQVRTIEPGAGRAVLIVVAHADDAALFIGGTVAAWADAGWRVVVVRVTDDRWDSVGSDPALTVAANRDEFERSSKLLGVAEIVELGYPTDTLGDVSMVELRERIIRQVRTHRPYALVSFDPYSMFGEDNLDHIAVARAVDESFWTSQFDLHHPEHLVDGLVVHGCFERWYFGRRVIEVTDVVDVSATLDRKVAAGCCHQTMMANYFNQLRLQAATGGWRLPMIDDALDGADGIGDVLPRLLRAGSQRTGERYGVGAAEEFRIVTFGGLEALLDAFGERDTD